VNRLVGGIVGAVRSAWGWAQRRRYIGPASRFLRAHWLETVALVSIVALIVAVDPPRLIHTFARMSWQIALAMIPVAFATYVVRGLAWYVALRHIGSRLSLWRTVAIEIAGQVMVFMPMGDLARVAMARRAGYRRRDAGELAGTIAFQELVFMTFLGFGVLPRVATQRDVALLVLLMTLAHVGIFAILIWKRAYDWAVRTVEKVRFLRRFDKQLRDLRPAFVALFHPRALVPILLCNAVAAGLNFLLFYLALRALGQDSISFVSAAFVLGLSYIVAGLSFIPGGVGAFEGLATVVMIGNGIPPAIGAAVTLLYRGYNDILMAVVGAPVALAVRRLKPPRGRAPAAERRGARA
jgi:glycosyltransferase 2 family protein